MLLFELRLPLESSLGKAPSIPHQVPRRSKREVMLPKLDSNRDAEMCAIAGNACKPRTTSRIDWGAS